MRAIAGLALSLCVAVAPMAQAFVLEGPQHRPWAAIEDLSRAARWDAGEHSLKHHGVRGLGGGLEYAVDDSLCTRLRFLDAPDCDSIKQAVHQAAARWSEGHPDLALTDVSAIIPVASQGQVPPSQGQGAEVDFFAADAIEFAPFQVRRTAAVTVYYFDPQRRPRLTNGLTAELSNGTLTAADIRFSTDACYFMDAGKGRIGCAHFPSLVMHELAHVYGIDHPDQMVERNLDSDNDPSTPVVFDCLDPASSLRVSESVEVRSVALANLWGANVWRHSLRLDDIAAREALYPRCPVEGRMVTASLPAPSISAAWGAFARGLDGALISISGALTQADALRRVSETCSALGHDCETVASFTDCFAYAEDTSGGGVWAASTDRGVSAARTGALSACAARGGECAVRESFCAAQ
jgi:hypothetical protein